MLAESSSREGDRGDPGGVEPSGESGLEQDVDLPPVPLLAPGSDDDSPFQESSSSSGSRIVPAEPDPVLGPFVTPSSGSATSSVLEGPPPAPSGGPFPAIDLGSRVEAGSNLRSSDPEEAGDDEPEGRRTSWASVLLLSYASAITIGLAWTLLKDRRRETLQAPAPPPPAAVAAESARQAGLSRKIEPPEPILGEHFLATGKPLRVGDLEASPVDVKRQAVTLERSTPLGKADRKAGGKGALVLRLRLKNVSRDAVFAPLDQAYLRERGKGIVDTFVETKGGERIYPYPLAIESEWSIVDQPFEALRPGESRTVAIVSAPEAPPDSSGPFTWRVRLRTGIDRTDVVGLRWPAE